MPAPRGNKNALGHKHTEEIKKQISHTLKGKKPWNTGKHLSEEHKLKVSKAFKGRIFSKETRKKFSEAMKNRVKNGTHPNYKGGITPINYKIRNSFEYKLWREAVFKKDDYTCVFCGLKFIKGITGDVVLNADHIKPFCDFPELRFAIDNGRTLCIECHKKTDTYCRNKKI